MYLIAICDDDRTELNKTEKMLSEYKAEHLERVHPKSDFEVECFTDVEELLSRVRAREYVPDLILMDIYMPGKTGIEATEELRDMGNESKIIFLTASREHALEAFRVDATQYLTKPVSEEELYVFLDRLLAEVAEERKRYVVLQADKRICRIAVQDVIYCEAQKKSQYIYLTDGTQLCLRMSMAGLEALFSGFPEIVRVGNSYIVNLRHIESLNGQELQMDTGKKLYVAKRSYQFLREQYFSYYTEGLA